ncbi:MAG TPA: hypothetical protein VFJ47_08585 [Terriglobales bacterium]|nr:hypothetical protein [Terriglobales bacterium]
MMLQNQDRSLEQAESILRQSLGRELTAREKFYLALAEAARSNQERESRGAVAIRKPS